MSSFPMSNVGRRLVLGMLLTAVSCRLLGAAESDADRDWLRRSRAEGVVIAVGFDDIREWARYNFDRSNCNSAYQVEVDSRKVGCRNNAWDPSVKASGRGSVRFDVLSETDQGAGGMIAIPFGDYVLHQFGANQELWVSWRQRMDARFLQSYRADAGGTTAFKQVIIAQGDIPIDSGKKTYPANACSEGQIVVVSSSPADGAPYPLGYIECLRYFPFAYPVPRGRFAGEARGSSVLSVQNMRRNALGQLNCIHFPKQLDRSGCFEYRPNEWTTYMVRLKLGPEGRAVSSVSRVEQPGYIDSVYELYAARPGQDFELLHQQAGLVIPKGQHYLGGDPGVRSSYKAGWGPGDAHPHAKVGKLWLLPYMTSKDPKEVTEKASTWYDEVIVSRCRIAAPGQPQPAACSTPVLPADAQPRTPAASAPTPAAVRSIRESVDAKSVEPASASRPASGVVPEGKSEVPRESKSPLTSLQIAAVLQNLKPGQWFEFPRSEMARVLVNACASASIKRMIVQQFGREFGCSPDRAMAYSGGAYDSKRHRLLVWGGGHGDYAGNEIYAFNVQAGTWTRLTEPTPGLFEYRYEANNPNRIPNEPPARDPSFPPAPLSVHSYDQIEYLPEKDVLFAVGGSTFGPGYASRLTWFFDFNAGAWRQSQTVAPSVGPLIEHSLLTAYDPVSKRIILRGYGAAATFDPQREVWQLTRKNLPTRGLGTVGELDPKRRLFFVVGSNRKELYEVGPNGEIGADRSLVTSGAVEIEECYAPGLVYDSKIERFVAWCGGGNVYSFDIDSGIWTRHATTSTAVPGDPRKTVGIRGTFGRFRYMPEFNAYVVVNGTRENVFLYRLALDKSNIAH